LSEKAHRKKEHLYVIEVNAFLIEFWLSKPGIEPGWLCIIGLHFLECNNGLKPFFLL
jgi:hypothetical protein